MTNKLLQIQSELKAPKNQYNAFGKYKYRNLEDILEALKPLLLKYECLLCISDEIVEVGSRLYVKAIVAFYEDADNTNVISVTAYARESAEKKGMDAAQITGAASSYARKYALNGLFLIDDTKDADTMENTTISAAKSTALPSRTQILQAGEQKDIMCEKCDAKMFKSKNKDKNGNDYYYCSEYRNGCTHKYWPPKEE